MFPFWIISEHFLDLSHYLIIFFYISESLSGKVNFTLKCNDHIIGEGTFEVCSRLEQLRKVIEKETSPLSFICQALGITDNPSTQMTELDTTLAKKISLSQVPVSLKHILTSEESTNLGNVRLMINFFSIFGLMNLRNHIMMTLFQLTQQPVYIKKGNFWKKLFGLQYLGD